MRYLLGKHPARRDHRNLKLARYFTPALPPPPPQCDWSSAVAAYSMKLNDTLGCCAIAAPCNQIETWRDNAGFVTVITDSVVLATYKAITGYDGTPATDNGSNETDVLNYWRKTGIGGHTIGAWGDVEPDNTYHAQQVVNLFGGAYIGISCPRWLVKLLDNGEDIPDTWDLAAGQAPDPDAGHAVEVVGYLPGLWKIVSWARTFLVTNRCLVRICDEFHGVLSADMLNGKQQSPTGLDMGALQTDLAIVTG
jgi:hypothetical protein